MRVVFELSCGYNFPSMKKSLPLYSVSQINAAVKAAIEDSLPPRLMVRGQISDWRRHSSGHCYFLLKDEQSQIGAILWASKFKSCKFLPENGLEVIAVGHVEVYPPQGRYQFYVDSLQPAGIGALQLAFEQMKNRLMAEGLFEEAHKKPLPRYPMRIGIVTSRSGAALVDIVDSICHRWPCAELFVYDVPVQGAGAAEKIAKKLAWINENNRKNRLDVLILGRGGGSMEDLWAFNEEVLARAIYTSRLPIISAVGHEVDVTIADFVADARASTPTKAGVIAVPDYREVLHRLDSAQARLLRDAQARVKLALAQLNTVRASWVFREPVQIVDRAAMRLDDASVRLARAARQRFSMLKTLIERSLGVLRRIEPVRLLAGHRIRLARLEEAVRGGVHKALGKKNLQLAVAENRLQAMDPRSVLRRGYSITVSGRTGKVVTSPEDVREGDLIVTELADQQKIDSEVKRKYRQDESYGKKEDR